MDGRCRCWACDPRALVEPVSEENSDAQRDVFDRRQWTVTSSGGTDLDWTAPDEEVFRFVTDETRQVGVHLLGRRLLRDETADQDPSLDDSVLEWAAIWKPLPKVAFSVTLSAVQGNARLASVGLAAEIERLRAELGQGRHRDRWRGSRRRGGPRWV